MFHLTPQEEKVLKAAVLVIAVGTLTQAVLKKDARLPGWIKAAVVVDQRIDINRAGLSELEAVAGIGPKTAKRIIEYRREYGDFRDLAPLLKMKGMTPERYERLKAHLRV